jgi:RNA polymerase sigma-70 factor (ECF subfamily)
MDRLIADDQLIARVAAADSVALKTLYMRHQNRIFGFIARIVRDEAVAEELTNEVFVDVWKHAGGYEGRSRATTWLLSCSQSGDPTLRKQREEPWDDDTAANLPEADDSEVALQKPTGPALALLHRAVERVPRNRRSLLSRTVGR